MNNNKIYTLLLAILLVSPPIIAQSEGSDSIKLSMEEAIQYALEHSYESQKAMQDVYRSKKKIWEATAIGLPQVNAGASYNYNIKLQETPVNMADFTPGAPDEIQYLAFGTKQNLGANISASQLLFDGGYFVGLQSARTVAAISDLAKVKTDILVTEAVTNAYIGVLVSDATIQILQRNIDNIESNITQIKAMYQNGLTEEQDVEQLELNLAGLNNAMNQNQRLAKINREMLKFAMGMDIGQPVILNDDIEKILFSFYQVATLEEALDVETHIDFQISENNLKSSDLLLRYEKTKYMPNLSAFFNAGYNSYSEVFDFFKFSDSWRPMSMVGLELNIPIFSSFQRKAKVDMAKIDYEKARLDHEQLIQNLFRELHMAQDAYAYSIDNFLTNKRSMELAERIEKKENIKYQEGVSTSLDLTNAQNQLYNSQQNYLNAILLVVQSKVALDKALNKL